MLVRLLCRKRAVASVLLGRRANVNPIGVGRNLSAGATPPEEKKKEPPAMINYMSVGVPAYATLYATTLGMVYTGLHYGITVESLGLDPDVAQTKVTIQLLC